MVFIKKVVSGSKTYYYLVRSYRIKNSVQQEIIKRLSPEEANDPTFITDFLNQNPSYQSILYVGYHDAWLESPATGDRDGLTFCHDADLLNPYTNFYERIDIIFHRSNQSHTYFKTGPVVVVGDRENSRTPSGLWPSDHGGVIAKLHLKKTSIAHK